MIPDQKIPVARRPAGGKAFALTPSRKIPYPLLRHETWVYVGTVGDGNGVIDQNLKENPFPFQYGATPGPPAFANSWTVPTGGKPVRFCLTLDGFLKIEGDFGGGADDTTVFTLPSAFRPTYDTPYILPTTNPEAFAIIIIQADGQVVYKGAKIGLQTIPGLVGGIYGSATQVAQVTVDSNGRILVAANVAIQITESQVTSLTADLATTAITGGPYHRVRLRSSATAGVAEVGGPNMLVPTAMLGTGTADNTTFLRGDQTYATPAGSGGGVTLETSLILGLGL